MNFKDCTIEKLKELKYEIEKEIAEKICPKRTKYIINFDSIKHEEGVLIELEYNYKFDVFEKANRFYLINHKEFDFKELEIYHCTLSKYHYGLFLLFYKEEMYIIYNLNVAKDIMRRKYDINFEDSLNRIIKLKNITLIREIDIKTIDVDNKKVFATDNFLKNKVDDVKKDYVMIITKNELKKKKEKGYDFVVPF